MVRGCADFCRLPLVSHSSLPSAPAPSSPPATSKRAPLASALAARSLLTLPPCLTIAQPTCDTDFNDLGGGAFTQGLCESATYSGGLGYSLMTSLPSAPCGETCAAAGGSTQAEIDACALLTVTGTDYSGGAGTDRLTSCEGTADPCTYTAPTTCTAAVCCDDVDGCAANPCGVGSTCSDTAAPATGHTCTCDNGYFGPDEVDGDGSGCTACDAVVDATSVTCAAAADSRAVCSTGYEAITPASGSDTCDDTDGCSATPCTATISTCADAAAPGTGHVCQCTTGHFGSDDVNGDGSGCTACDPVANSASITCTAAGNTRAVCQAGFVLTDNTAGGTSDTCVPPTCDSTDACSPCADGSFPTGATFCPGGAAQASCSMTGTTWATRSTSCEATAGCTYVGSSGSAHADAVCGAATQHIIDSPASVTCGTFPCTQTECCADNICTCTDGVPGTVANFQCAEHDTNQCASCNAGLFRDTNFACQTCATVANAWPEGASYTCTAADTSELTACGGAGQQPCCADGYYLVPKGTVGNSADECQLCVEDVANAYPASICVPASTAEQAACAAAGQFACPLIGGCAYAAGSCSAVVSPSASACTAAVNPSDSLLVQQQACRAQAGCMYRPEYTCSTATDSVTNGCAPGTSPGGDVSTGYDAHGYTATCTVCGPGLYGSDGTCAACSQTLGSQTEACKPGGTYARSIADCAAVSLTTPSSFAATWGPLSNQGRCEAVVGLAEVLEICAPVDCNLAFGTSGFGTTGYVQGTFAAPSATCGFYCSLTPPSQDGTQPETCTPLVTDCSVDQNGDAYVAGTETAITTTCYGNLVNQGGPGGTTCLDPNTGTQRACQCTFVAGQDLIPGCIHETFAQLPANSGATACTTCTEGTINGDATTDACTNCVAGQYQPAAGTDSCIACGLGSLTAHDTQYIGQPGGGTVDPYEGAGTAGGSRCDVCAAGTYTSQTSEMASTCAACAPGSSSDPVGAACYFASDEQYLSVCAALLTQSDCAGNANCAFIIPGTTCRDCLSGTFQDTAGQDSCRVCSPGSRTNTLMNLGAVSCSGCTPGEYSTVSTSACIACAAGSEVATRTCAPSSASPTLAEQDACALIMVSGATEANRQASCVSPASGGLASCAYSEAPTAGNTGGNTCDACVPGQISTVSSTPCADCLGGTYSTGGTISCSNCEIGRYQGNPGIGVCIACADGSETEIQTGAATACTSCSPGTYATHTVDANNVVTASMACDDCAVGSVSTGGAALCDLCAPGLYMNVIGQTACINCIAGSVTLATAGGVHTSGTGAVDCQECVVGEFSTAANIDCAVCQPGAVTYRQGSFHTSTGSDACNDCIAGKFSPIATTDCADCAAGSQTADGGAFMHIGATTCGVCAADAASQSLTAQTKPSCTAVVTTPLATPATIALCAALCTVADQPCTQAACENAADDPSVAGNVLCVFTPAIPTFARGFADLDSTSTTACHECQFGTFATAAGQVECVDFDECASNPCGNGATCADTIFTGTALLAVTSYGYDAGFTCTCAHGFEGHLCQYLNECDPALDPCGLSTTTVPGTSRVGTAGSVYETPNRFLCPVNMVCNDPDSSITDDYTCTCPACDADISLSASTATLLTSYFSTHPAVSRYVARNALELNQPEDPSTCRNPTNTGCMDATAFNYDPAAGVDDGSCVAKVFGCMDKRALNFDSTATAYDASGGAGAMGTADPLQLCHGKYCETPADCVSVFAHHDVCKAYGEYSSCPGSVCNPVGQICADTTGQLPEPAVQASCDGADISSTDVFTATAACEAQSANTYPGYEAVCRYVPIETNLCPATTDDTDGAEHDGTCTCPAGTTDLALGSAAASMDECALTNFNGVDEGTCSSSAHRLCAVTMLEPHAVDVHHGFPGRHCVAFRDAFVCPDSAGGNNQFACVDPNPFWMGDYSCDCAVAKTMHGIPDIPRTCTAKPAVVCGQPGAGATVCPDNVNDCVFTPGASTLGSCAISTQAECTAALGISTDGAACSALMCTYAEDPRHDATTIASCGSAVLFTDTSTDPPTTVTNYLMTLLLEASATARSHVCKLIGSPADCTRGAL